MEKYYPIYLLFILFFLNIPIAYALLISSLYYFIFLNQVMNMNLIIQNMVASLESFPLLAVPFFIMVGSVMNYSGISRYLLKMAEVLTGHLRGGLAQVNIILSALMGGISGSANADAAMQSKILVPEMVKRGFSPAFSAAITAASSCIAPIIPPGTNLIIYSLLANVSISKMFIAGYTPAIFITIALMITVFIISTKRNYGANREKATFWEILIQLKDSIWALLIPLGIIMGMRFGIFTPTEAGGMAVFLCVLIGTFVYKTLKWRDIPVILKDTVLGTGSVMLLIVGAKVFGFYMTLEQIPQAIASSLIGFTDSPMVMLFLINILLLVVGMFIEGGAALLILVPLLLPVIKALNIDLIHFGVVVILNIMIGGITPPFGSMMFTTCSIVGVKLTDFIKEILPFIIALLLVLALFTVYPLLSTFVPSLLGG
ncbi:MAG: TRAP transporter large permease [Brevinema sp.]